MSASNLITGRLPDEHSALDLNASDIKFAEIFAFLFEPKRYKIARGGRGSAKSTHFALALLLIGMDAPKRILCVREIQKSIDKSVYKILIDLIKQHGLDDENKFHDGVYRYTKDRIWHDNGTEFMFSGLRDNVDSVRSMEGVDICWVEEAHSVSADSWNVLIPTIRKQGSEIWITYNPDSDLDPVHVRFGTVQDDDTHIAIVNWRDNPWFPETLRKEMERDKKRDFKQYLVTWEGFTKEQAGKTIFNPRLYNVYHDAQSISGNCYILVDPANTKKKKSDYTTMWVIVACYDGNAYVVDGLREKLVMEKFDRLFAFYQKYRKLHRSVTVCYERYGMQMDIDYIKERQERTGIRFRVKELGSATRNTMSKPDHIRRLVPWFSDGKLWWPETMERTGMDGETYDMVALLKQELGLFNPVTGIPDGFHDDLSDCLANIEDAGLEFPTDKRDGKARRERMRKAGSYDPARYGFDKRSVAVDDDDF